MSKKRIGVYFTDKMLEMCDANIERFDAKNRSDLIELALNHLIASKDTEVINEIITPRLDSSIRAAVRDSESHITSMLFKLAVEIDILSHINAAANDIDLGTLNRVRAMCVDEVKSTRGKINFDDAAKLQSRNKK